MVGTLQALGPVVLVILAGYALRRSGFVPEADWRPVERLVYFVLFPALLFRELAGMRLGDQPAFAFALTLIAAQLAMAAFASLARRILALPGPAYTSLAQGVVRWNTYVGLALAEPLFGAAAVPWMGLAVAVLVPPANLLAVWALSRHGAGSKERGMRRIGRALVTNPLLLACVAGGAWNALDLPLSGPPDAALEMMSQATLALGLLSVGAGLRLGAVAGRPLPMALACLGKLVLMPLLTAALAGALGLTPLAQGVAVLATAMPSASTSYILARLLGGDAELMAAILTVQTALTLVTLPVILALLT